MTVFFSEKCFHQMQCSVENITSSSPYYRKNFTGLEGYFPHLALSNSGFGLEVFAIVMHYVTFCHFIGERSVIMLHNSVCLSKILSHDKI